MFWVDIGDSVFSFRLLAALLYLRFVFWLDFLFCLLLHLGISGGEKRRLAIGLQMIGLESPSVVLIDEPSSGLDSHQALQVGLTDARNMLQGTPNRRLLLA